MHPDYRGIGLSKRIKDLTFSLARTRWPNAKIFSLTSGAAVMVMNTQLGYKPVTFADLTDDEAFWKGCEGCCNVDVLQRTNRRYCICTAMLFDPEEHLPAKIPQEVLDRIARLEGSYSPPLPPLGGENTPQKKYQSADPTLYGKLREFAVQNRKNQTEAESALWSFLQKNQLGVGFRRQHIIGSFIGDFVCIPLKLIIEVDGGYHQLPEQQISDEERVKWLEDKGYSVVRFTNEEVIGNTQNVINKIKEIIWKLSNK